MCEPKTSRGQAWWDLRVMTVLALIGAWVVLGWLIRRMLNAREDWTLPR